MGVRSLLRIGTLVPPLLYLHFLTIYSEYLDFLGLIFSDSLLGEYFYIFPQRGPAGEAFNWSTWEIPGGEYTLIFSPKIYGHLIVVNNISVRL